MTTARDMIGAALRLLGVLAAGEEPAAAEAADGLDALNRMLHGWKARGVDIGHADLALGDAPALADEFTEGATRLLALRLAPEYGRTLDPALVLSAGEAWAALQMAHGAAAELAAEGGLLNMPGEGWGRAR